MHAIAHYRLRLVDLDQANHPAPTQSVNRAALRGMFTVRLTRDGLSEAEARQALDQADSAHQLLRSSR